MIIRCVHDGTVAIGVRDPGDASVHPLPMPTVGALLALSADEFRAAIDARDAVPLADVRLLPPVDGLIEVWASGVTYRRSSDARQEESEVADVYARVYDADRPELFFKSPAWRVCGDGEPIGIRADSLIDVPEPELALVCNADGAIVGLTVSNDVSSRSIEGENPLYLPQAKIYSGACALGPCIVPVWEVDEPADLSISVSVRRDEHVVWAGSTTTAAMHRSYAELVEHLFRHVVFPEGVVLSTGTGLVPDLDFSLAVGDEVRVEIEGIGALTTPVRSASPAEFAWLTPDPSRTAPGWMEQQ